jgi:TRAP-type mannitol/chloroaromatic compound transport system substrate-binding protein
MTTRRAFITAAIGGVTTSAVAAPALAQTQPQLRWRMVSSFPPSTDTLWKAGELFCRRVGEMTDGSFTIRPFAPGEIVGALQVLDAVSNNTVECGDTASYYYTGKDEAFAFGSALPFGLNARQQNAWWYHGGGAELNNDFYKNYNIYSMPIGNSAAQMGGWFRKEINSISDLNGLKFRVGGLAGHVMARIGVVPQQIGAGDIYTALERGTIDAAEFGGPSDDEKLGFAKVAKYYYAPGFGEGNAMINLFINRDRWLELPKKYQNAMEVAAADASMWHLSRIDAFNTAAMTRLLAAGTELRQFPRDVLEAAYAAAFALYEETAAKNPRFKAIYEPWLAFRRSQYAWFRVNEISFDVFNVSQLARG